jgi:maltooligosyltrehalose trehalohydrolase
LPSRYRHALPFGAEVLPGTVVRFRLWAPAQPAVTVVVEDGECASELAMVPAGNGWFELTTERAAPDSRYRYRLADDLAVPDPASRYQPYGVDGVSQVVDPCSYVWQNDGWRGRPWEEVVLYELHLGCYSPEGNFDGVRRRLDHLVQLGITAIELMPIADFAGRRNWGYDGVLPFAPAATYGTPDALKRLIDEAHGRGLMMFLDVVYNHFGPSGNYLHRYAPDFFTARYQTPWGSAINFAATEVRDFAIHNALYWLLEYRFDGLRLDAVHAIHDDSQPDILQEIAAKVRAQVDGERQVHLVLENDDNAPHYLQRDGAARPRHYVAQWNDDFHHAAHVIAVGETHDYYADYAKAPVRDLARALAEGFAYQGEISLHRRGARRGGPSIGLPPTAFVSFIQNHDQIGNRPFGERLAILVEEERLRAFTALLLLSPQIPMLFMGEEWASERPFLFFCDFAGELAQAVREGRQREFAELCDHAAMSAERPIPDPNAADTFARSSLDWHEGERTKGRRHLELVRRLLEMRRSVIAPRLAGTAGNCGSYDVHAEQVLRVCWQLGDGSRLTLIANLSPRPAHDVGWALDGERLYMQPAGWSVAGRLQRLPAWAVGIALDAATPPR